MRIERRTENGEPKWTLSMLRALNSNGTSVLVLPGGGYGHLATGHEGDDIAAWLNARGYDAWVLEYRVVGEHHAAPLDHKPLEDAREALEHMRREGQMAAPPRKVGVWGFSAGGHLAASLATESDTHLDFLVLAYPVISLDVGMTHGGSRRNLLGETPGEDVVRLRSAHNRVSAATPPTFIFHTSDDASVPVENAILFYRALRQNGVPAELHIYETGRHGVGLAPDDAALRTWAVLLEAWLERHTRAA